MEAQQNRTVNSTLVVKKASGKRRIHKFNNSQICTRQCPINQLRNYDLQSIDSLNIQIYSRIWGPESEAQKVESC